VEDDRPTRKEDEMPRHWRPIAPDNPNSRKERGEEVKTKAGEHGGIVEFVGSKGRTNQWFMLVDVTNVGDPEQMAKDCKERGPATVYWSSDEAP
jgi:hypothetical protein